MSERSKSGGVRKPCRSVRLSAFQRQLQRRLSGGSFRQLNERLYTTSSASAHALLRAEPALFDVYHEGFVAQTRRWPANPLHVIIRYLNTLEPCLRVADMGCGDARLARDVVQTRVHSFDLVARNPRVVECDIRRTPLPACSVDVVVYCLALMGTNYAEYLDEGVRILVEGGRMLVAEVNSRFEANAEETFVQAMKDRGMEREHVQALSLDVKGKRRNGTKRAGRAKRKKSKDNDLFLMFAFRKTSANNTPSTSSPRVFPPLAPCVYKKR